MIRRTATLAQGQPAWLLIPQAEHARLSGLLADACTGNLLSTADDACASASEPPSADLAPLRQELLTAIRRHDDGWNAWEQRPRCDAATGRPLAFDEVSPAEAAEIWTRSIDGVATVGPLAAATVAGHFLRLLEFAEHLRDDPVAAAWRKTTLARRTGWIAELEHRRPPLAMPLLAEQALAWLRTFDELSLALCCDCPPGGVVCDAGPLEHAVGRGTPLAMNLAVRTAGSERTPAGATAVEASATPWRFAGPRIEATLAGRLVPQADDGQPPDWSQAKDQTLALVLVPR